MKYMRTKGRYTWTEYTKKMQGIKFDLSFGQNIGIQKKLVAKHKRNAL